MTKEIRERLTPVFREQDLEALVEVYPFADNSYWIKVISVVWDGQDYSKRVDEAISKIKERFPDLFNKIRVVIHAITPEEDKGLK